jgi:osmotically-inducible protein OsmY
MKNKLIQSLFLIGAALSTTLLSGCLPVLATGMVGGAMVVADRRPTAVVTIDRGLQLEVESMLQKKYGANSHINVNVYNQKVLLTGEVPFENIKQEIDAQLKDFKNIKPPLINELKVEALSSTSTRISDSSLYALIKGRLVATTDVPSNSMKIVVESGRVYMLGIATELEAKAAGLVASKSSDSIKEVNKYFDIITEEEKRKIEGTNTAPVKK